MDPEYDPVVGFARAAETMAETQRSLEQTQQYIAQTQRLGLKIQAFACVMLGASLLFLGYVIWQHLAQGQEHALLIHALTETLQRLPKPYGHPCPTPTPSPRRHASVASPGAPCNGLSRPGGSP